MCICICIVYVYAGHRVDRLPAPDLGAAPAQVEPVRAPPTISVTSVII